MFIYATAENGTTPSGTGQFLLTSIAGVIQNDFFVVVTAANGQTRSYQVQIIKSDSSDLNSDTSIKDIAISTANGTYDVNFNPDNAVQEPIILDL